MTLVPWRQKRSEDDRSYGNGGQLATQDFFRGGIDQFFENFFRDPFGMTQAAFTGGGAWVPSLEVSETEKEVAVRAELPGVKPEDLDIHVTGNTLVLAGEKKQSSEQKGEGFYHSERRFGSFRREVPLPTEVDADKVTADYSAGVLTVRLQKSEVTQAKRIPVNVK
jgi:HSP20 family protein